MSLAYQILASWRDPAVKAQRNWVFLQFWGRSAKQRVIWFVGYLLLFCCMWLYSVDGIKHLYIPMSLLVFTQASCAAEVTAALKRWRLRAPQLRIVITQALFLHGLVWSLLGWIVFYHTVNPTLLFLLSFVLLFAYWLAFAAPQVLTKNSYPPLQGQAFKGLEMWVVLMPASILFFLPQYEWLIRQSLLVALIGLLLAMVWQLNRFVRPRQLAKIKRVECHVGKVRQQATHPLLLRLEMNMGGALDQKGLRKIAVSLFLMPYGMILTYQHLLHMPVLNQWGAGAVFAMLIPGFLGLFIGRRQWSNSWLVRSHSRAQLWWQDEQLFLGILLLTAVLNCALLLVLQIDNARNVMNAALLFVFGLSSLRYLIFSVQWMSLWTLSADGRATQTGYVKTFACLMPVWIGVGMVWGSGVQSNITQMILAFTLAAPILAYVSYRKALSINLAAIRRAKRS